MTPDLQGRIAVVTGASRGLGRCVAARLAACGARVALVARSAQQLRETAQAIQASGGVAHAFPSEIGNPAGMEALKARIETMLGPPAILVNAAGIFGPIQPIADSDAARWIETITTNTIGPYLTCRAFVGGMIGGGWGRIVNFTSAASLHPPGPLNSAYAVSKVALNQMTRHLAAELAGTGVTANVIHPGDVKTDMWAAIRDEAEALGPAGEAYREWVRWVHETGGDDPAKAADLVLHLMSDQAAGVNGQFLWIEDGQQKPIPSWGQPEGKQPWQKQP
jgi:NAD(P)-dependent dehydrogenase (short-subunit alcohol dehydrogenase family)